MLASFCASRRDATRRDAQNEREGAGLRSSVAAATPSQLRRSSAARTMSGRRGFGQPLEDHIEQPLDEFATVTSSNLHRS